MNMFKPKVSVIVPTYNNANYIEEALKSIMAQDYQDYEIIVIDDGSTDKTREIVQSLGDNIKYVYQANQGLAGARNTGVQRSKGDYITFLDGDDIWETNNLSIKVKVLEEYPLLGAVFSDFFLFNKHRVISQRGMRKQYPIFSKRRKTLDEIFSEVQTMQMNGLDVDIYKGNIFQSLLFGNFINACSILIRKTCQEDIGFFRDELRTQQDYEYWLRFSRRFEIAFLDMSLVWYRRHEDQLTAQMNTERIILNVSKILEPYYQEHAQYLSISAAKEFRMRYSNVFQLLGLAYLGSRNNYEARNAFKKSIRIDHRNIKSYILWLFAFMSPIITVDLMSKLKGGQ